MSTPTHLHSMPLNLDAWQHIVAGISARDEGIFFRAVRTAWTAQHRGAPACTLPADPKQLRALLGDRAAPSVVRRFFQPVEGAPHLLAWPWLTAAWETALGRYEAHRKGGQMSAARNRKPHSVSQERPEKGGAQHRAQHRASTPASSMQPEPNSTKKQYWRRSADAGRGGAASAPSPQEPGPIREHPARSEAESWLRTQPPEVVDELERRVDAQLRAEMPRRVKLSPDGPLYAAVRARMLEEFTARAYIRSQVNAARYLTREEPCADHTPGILEPPASCAKGAGRGELVTAEVPVA